MRPVRTSATDPIQVDFIPKDAHGLEGQLGMTFAPGKKAPGLDCEWDRDLTVDLLRLRKEYGTDVLVSLVEAHELEKLHIPGLPAIATQVGILLDRFAIPDVGVPADEARFVDLVRRTVAHLRAGKTVVIHCKGGLGRTGLLAAACLRAVGVEGPRAIKIVRAARVGTIENDRQYRFVVDLALPDAAAEAEVRPFDWPGVLKRELCADWLLAERDAIADSAKVYDWPTLLRLLGNHANHINAWRTGGTSWYAPLHQAAHGGAPIEVVEQLLALGAWRTLRTAKDELPVDIARRRGHQHPLEPSPVRDVDAQALGRVQEHFHAVIRARVAVIDGILDALRLPELAPATEFMD